VHNAASATEGLVGKDRLAAFSDGVIAIIITIMVLELRLPDDAGANALVSIALYVLVAIIWLVPDRRIERVVGDA
jgi:uncharacterized membrane protein